MTFTDSHKSLTNVKSGKSARVCAAMCTLRKTTPPETTVRPGGLLMAAAARTKLHFVPLVRPVPQR